MTKTPGQVAYEAACMGKINIPFDHLNADQQGMWQNLEIAVIAAARPQIEAEARAAMVERVMDILSNEMVTIKIREQIRALAALPPTHVCVPVEPTEAMIEASMQSPTALELHKGVTTDAWELLKESSILRYKAMLAASKGDECPKTTP